METIHQRWDREEKLLETSSLGDGWRKYSWDELALFLSPERLEKLQKRDLKIPRFKNDAGNPVGKFTDRKNKKGWTGFRDRLKPFYIYNNIFLVYWKPNMWTKTSGNWNIGCYPDIDADDIIKAFNWATKNIIEEEANFVDNMVYELKNNVSGWAQKSNIALKPLPMSHNTYVNVGDGSVLDYADGHDGWTTTFKPVEWTADGELKSLKSAKNMAENSYLLAEINKSTFKWMFDEDKNSKTLSRIMEAGDINRVSFWVGRANFIRNINYRDILVRPKLGHIINWHNHLPRV